MRLFNLIKKKEVTIPTFENPFDLRTPIARFSNSDFWTIADACEGTQIFGATGSGKTSGSGQTIAKSFLRSGFGGLVLTAKKDDFDTWAKYAYDCGVQDHFIVVSPHNDSKFNFLDYELNRGGSGAGLTENIVNLFYTVMEVAERNNKGGGGEAYWERTLKQLLRNTIDLLSIAKGKLSLKEMYEVITSAPQDFEDLQSEAWRNNSFCFQMIMAGEGADVSPSKRLDFEVTAKYWLSEFPGLAEKTRSVIVSSFTSLADSFLRGMLRDLFCSETTFVPELCLEGAIIIIDLPVKEYGQIGQYAQVLFKYIWQQAVERRNTNSNDRPVFLWADESQFFVSEYDQQFQSTARSSRACTVYLTQNLPNYLTALGDKNIVDAFLGNLQTKIFHSNGDNVTNDWAANVFAKTWQTKTSSSQSVNRDGSWFLPEVTGRNESYNSNESLEYQVQPHDFTTLRKGGLQNDLLVDSIIFQGGRTWNHTNRNFLFTTFSQQS